MTNLSLIAYEPLSEQGLYARDFVDDVSPNHERGQFSIAAVGGYDRSSFVLKGTRDYLDDWFDDGIMRRVAWYNPEAVLIWEGFVNRMRYSFSDTQKTKTMDGYYNRVYLKYTPLDFSVFPPIPQPPVTLIVDDAAEQARLGVKSAVVSGGERVDATAFDWARTVLRERSEVPEGESVNTQQEEGASIEVECLGYYHALKWLPYIKSASGTIQANQVVQEVLEYYHTVNPWVGTDFRNVDWNFRTASRGYDGLLSCWDVIVNLIKEGGSGGERWVGGLYGNRRMTYKQSEAPDGLYGDQFQLWRAIEDPDKAIYEVGTNVEVKPWDVLPDRALHTVDINTGGTKDLTYIEQMTFREPYSVQLVGGDDERLSVYLAQRGLPQL